MGGGRGDIVTITVAVAAALYLLVASICLAEFSGTDFALLAH